MRAMTFFGSGGLLLIACLAALSGWMRSTRYHTVEGHGLWSVARLGIRNAARHPGRSLLTAGLLASAAFLIVAVEACGLCGSDVHSVQNGNCAPGAVLGHEFSGKIAALGSAGSGWCGGEAVAGGLLLARHHPPGLGR